MTIQLVRFDKSFWHIVPVHNIRKSGIRPPCLTESSSQLIMTGIALPPVKGDVRPPVLLHKLRLCFTGVDVAPDREQRGKPF